MDVPELLLRWRAWADEAVPGLRFFDAHTHVGHRDPDGHAQSMEELARRLSATGVDGCFVFPFHEPDGYPGPNDAVREAAMALSGSSGGRGGAGGGAAGRSAGEAADGGGAAGGAAAATTAPMLVPFCRVNPWEDAVAEAERCLGLGARGIKLHPRAEAFTLDHPMVRGIFALADERRVPVLIHSGRGIEAPGEHILRLSEEFPGARVILAHAGATDLAWLWRVIADYPSVHFDTSWWFPVDLLTLFSLVPPAQILFASDAPYIDPLVAGVGQVRLALQAGWSPEQVRVMCAEQSLRLASGEPLAVAGPAVGERDPAAHLLMNRIAELIQLAAYVWIRGADGAEALSLARLACNIPDSHDDAPVCRAVEDLLDLHDELLAGEAAGSAAGSAPTSTLTSARMLPLMLASFVARTPDVALLAG